MNLNNLLYTANGYYLDISNGHIMVVEGDYLNDLTNGVKYYVGDYYILNITTGEVTITRTDILRNEYQTYYDLITDGTDSVREGARVVSGNLSYVVDAAITPTGFAGTENVDWENILVYTIVGASAYRTGIRDGYFACDALVNGVWVFGYYDEVLGWMVQKTDVDGFVMYDDDNMIMYVKQE